MLWIREDYITINVKYDSLKCVGRALFKTWFADEHQHVSPQGDTSFVTNSICIYNPKYIESGNNKTIMAGSLNSRP